MPDAEQTALREEMEYTRGYFAHQFGVEATGFTVLVGANYEALSPVYREVVGDDLSSYYHPQATYSHAFVTSSAQAGAVMTLINGPSADHIAHEYFHVLQGQLVSGFAQLQDGEIAWHTKASHSGPDWLVEGTASYADYAYTPFSSDRRPFFDRYSPYRDLAWFGLRESLKIGDLARIADYRTFNCTLSHQYSYSLSFAPRLSWSSEQRKTPT